MRFFLLLVLLLPGRAFAQWDWGWQEPPPERWAEDALLHTLDERTAAFGSRAIRFYQQAVVPAQGRPCPAWPSCSMYVRYSMARFGFARGLLLGIDRLFFRENAAFLRGHRTFTFLKEERPRVYDPPETNLAPLLHDWRQLHPAYRTLYYPGPPGAADPAKAGFRRPPGYGGGAGG